MKRIFFLLIIILLAGAIGLQVEKNILPYHWGNEEFSKKIQYLNQSGRVPQIVFLGSSVTHRHIIPSEFDQFNNTLSYNLAVDGNMPPQSFHLLEHLLEQEDTPEFIFVELNSFDNMLNGHFQTTRNKYYFNFRWLFISYNYLLNANITWRHKLGISYRYTVSFLEHLFKVGMRKDILDFREREGLYLDEFSVNEDGYASFPSAKTSNKKKLKELPIQLEETFNRFTKVYRDTNKLKSITYNKTLKQLLEKYIKKANDKNIHLIYILNPIPYTFDSIEEMVALFYSLPIKNRIDLANPNKNQELFLIQYRWDIGHFNYDGAIIYTKILSQRFKDLLN